VLKHGRFKKTSVDFEQTRINVLQKSPALALPHELAAKAGLYTRTRNALLKKPLPGFLITNLAYLKSTPSVHKQFFVSDRHKLVYLRIFKNASTSILKSMLPQLYEPVKDHALTDEQIDAVAHYVVRRSLTPLQKHYTMFAVVRNPFERTVSAYTDLFDPASDYFSYEDFLGGIFRKDMSFKEFINTLAAVPDSLRGPHLASQHSMIKQAGGGKDNLMIFRLETDKQQLADFLGSYGFTFGHQNKSKRTSDYKDYFDADTIKLVASIYKDDFDAFQIDTKLI
jgi:hypothetical protein